jgi:hypothetical protein
MRSSGSHHVALYGWALAAAALGTFLVTGLRHLDVVPQVYEDEPWQASTAYKLATSGVFGSDLFTGFHNMDQRYYGFMPLHPMLMAGVFKLLGVGLAQARVETVLLTAVTLVLTFGLGLRLFNAWVGGVAVSLLVLVRWTGLTYVQLTGIPVVDLARIARYDPLVPVLGLSALHIYLSARSASSASSVSPADSVTPTHWSLSHMRAEWLYGISGVVAALAGLAHVYGLFWVIALLVLAAREGPRRAATWIVAGAILPWVPYAAYVLADLGDWRGQTAIYASRFELLNARWYLDNLLEEYHRYGPGLGSPGAGWLLRPGFWFLLVALPCSLVALARRAFAGSSCAPSARALLVPALVSPALFAVFITLKLVNYTLIELPLFALAVAWGLQAAWAGSRSRSIRPLLGALAAAVVLEGGIALGRLEQASLTTTPYSTFVAEVRRFIPAGARIVGLHSYWLGFETFDYRSFLVPLNWADEGLPLDEGLSRVAPDVVLLDARMRAYFLEPEVAVDAARFHGWMASHSAELIGQVDDPTYGLMEIYRVMR